ncbi:hypothetical protein LCGC14_0941900 [marine sediment metagenome]|uniref:Uncharacterized protein n=1 Tax=marine sediment metagenome TaxID=412755 RepID=A0A0F9R3H6_9ZZZZ
MSVWKYRVYYSKDGCVHRSISLIKSQALARFEVFQDAFMVTKEKGWFRRILRLRDAPGSADSYHED